jgi:polysaccharide export outer membrane protein
MMALAAGWMLALRMLGGGSVLAADAYHLGPGDVLKIEVVGEQDLSNLFTISPRGTITFKLLGEVEAGGLTVTEVRDKLQAVLEKDFLLNPTVKVEIQEHRSKKILVLGEVRKPGEFFLKQDSTNILEVLSLVGGMTENAAAEVILFRRSASPTEGADGRDKRTINLQDVLSGRLDPDAEPILPDDILNFPSRKADAQSYQVYIEGKVKTPGAYEFRPSMTVYELCLEAGGFLPFAAENRTEIIRQEGEQITRIKVDIKKIKKGQIRDVPLSPGDKVIVPESWF